MYQKKLVAGRILLQDILSVYVSERESERDREMERETFCLWAG